ncbi:hypothetical protein FS837_000334 [Tulasnella sp. UAMH 9824]|nr:hypothetical protein FS837_000334 [Tulasnella sp. UAMH 9824]
MPQRRMPHHQLHHRDIEVDSDASSVIASSDPSESCCLAPRRLKLHDTWHSPPPVIPTATSINKTAQNLREATSQHPPLRLRCAILRLKPHSHVRYNFFISAKSIFRQEQEGLGGNRLWYEQMKRIHQDITDLEGALVKENGVVKEDID